MKHVVLALKTDEFTLWGKATDKSGTHVKAQQLVNEGK